MSKMGEKVAYLKGLAEGLGVTAETDKGKLMLAMIDTLEAFAEQAGETEEALHELQEVVDELEKAFGKDLKAKEDSEKVRIKIKEIIEKDTRKKDEEEDEDDDEEEEGLIEYECPHCGTVIFFDEEAFDMEQEHLCPNCNRKVFEEDENDGDDDE